MLTRRLRGLSGSRGPFTSAEVAIYNHFGTVRLARIEVAARDRDWRNALTASAAELSKALRDGFTETEFKEALAAIRSGLVRNAAHSSTPALADALADAVGRGIVFTAPADPAGTDAYLAQVRLHDVNAAFQAAWTQGGRLIFVTHNRPVTEAHILEAWQTLSMK
jgi:hypothetical protein